MLFEDTFTSFFKDKMLKRSHKTVEVMFFLKYFCLMEISGPGSVTLNNGSGSGSGRPQNIRRRRMGQEGQKVHWLSCCFHNWRGEVSPSNTRKKSSSWRAVDILPLCIWLKEQIPERTTHEMQECSLGS